MQIYFGPLGPPSSLGSPSYPSPSAPLVLKLRLGLRGRVSRGWETWGNPLEEGLGTLSGGWQSWTEAHLPPSLPGACPGSRSSNHNILWGLA